MLSDRRTSTIDSAPQSIWATAPGQWIGSVLFNDNHAEFQLSDKGFGDQYGKNRGVLGTGTLNNLFDMDLGNGQMTSEN